MRMLSSKKAQGLSLNTIIIAIIVLIVLVVIVMIFTGYFGKIFTPGVQSCTAQGGKCSESSCADTNTKTLADYRGATPADTEAAAKKAGCSASDVYCCSQIDQFDTTTGPTSQS